MFDFYNEKNGIKVRQIAMNSTLRYTLAVVFAVMTCLLSCNRNPASSDGNQLELLSSSLFSGPYYSIEVEGDYAYCGAAGSFQVISLADRANPVLVGGVSMPNSIYYMDVEGNYAYLGAREDGMIICDISNPGNPRIVGNWDISWGSTGEVNQVGIVGNYAIVANDNYGLQIIDISDPADPVKVGNYNEDGFRPIYFYLSGDFMYVDGPDDFIIIDISDLLNPVRVGNFGSRYGMIAGNGEYLYHGRNLTYLDIYSLANPVEPVLISSLEGSFGWFSITGDYIYATESPYLSDGNVTIIDISDPANPFMAGSYSTPNHADRILAKEDYLYVYDYHIDEIGELFIANILNPVLPVELGSYTPAGGATDVFVFDDIAFAVGNYGLHVVDVSDERNPVDMGHFEIGEFGSIVEVSDNYMLVVGERTPGLQIYDVSNPSDPIFLGSYGENNESGYYDIDVNGNYVFAAGGEIGLHILDTNDPSSPTLINQIDSIFAVYTREDYCYTAGPGSKLRIFDIADPSNPILLGEHEGSPILSGRIIGMIVVDQIAYMPLPSYGGVKIFNIADPANPTLIGEYDSMISNDIGFFAADDRVYIPMLNDGLHIIDVSDPANPVLDAVIECGFYTYGVHVVDDMVYVADASSLQIYRYKW
ncbi:MAG: hypothetical protein V3W18_11425 [candidate division Zixibacteria bacterium]